jgi:hypothetical protein
MNLSDPPLRFSKTWVRQMPTIELRLVVWHFNLRLLEAAQPSLMAVYCSDAQARRVGRNDAEVLGDCAASGHVAEITS